MLGTAWRVLENVLTSGQDLHLPIPVTGLTSELFERILIGLTPANSHVYNSKTTGVV